MSTQIILIAFKYEYDNQRKGIGIGKKVRQNSDDKAKWSANLVENKEYEINNHKEQHTVWVVEAIYPFENKIIVDFDAYTSEQIVLAEIEANN